MSVPLLGWSRDRQNWPNKLRLELGLNIFRGNEIYFEGTK